MDGRVILTKKAVGGDGTFHFTATGASLAGYFPKDATTVGGIWSKTFEMIDPDNSYTITETVPEGWDLTALSCNVGTHDTPPIGFPNTGKVSFTIPSSGEVTCTFENTKRGQIKIEKYSYDGTGIFTFDLTWMTGPYIPPTPPPASIKRTIDTSITNPGHADFGWLVPYGVFGQGSYTLTETNIPDRWMQMTLKCVSDLDPTKTYEWDPESHDVVINLAPGETVTCTIRNIHKSIVTSSSLCTFDIDSGRAGDQFRLLFTTDVGGYRMTATNPGQFYYNMFTYYGLAEDRRLTMSLTLPYPFVTQGATPIHAYTSASISEMYGEECITPSGEVYHNSDQIWTMITGAWSGDTFGDTHLINLDFFVPDNLPPTGFIYVNIHLDYGLKGSIGWTKWPRAPDSQYIDAVGGTQGPYPGLKVWDDNPYEFSFSVVGDGTDTAVVRNKNDFKKNPGVGGQVCLDDGNPDSSDCTHIEPGVTIVVSILNPKTGYYYEIGRPTSDEYGFYFVSYKYSGKLTSVKACVADDLSNCVYSEIKSNAFVWMPAIEVQ